MNRKLIKRVGTGDRDTDALLYDEEVNQHLKEHEVILYSVGSVLNTKLAKLYPLMADGTVERSSDFNLEDVDIAWFDYLSEDEHTIAHRTMINYPIIAPQDAVKIKRLLEDCKDVLDGSFLLLTKGSVIARRQVFALLNRLKGVTGIE